MNRMRCWKKCPEHGLICTDHDEYTELNLLIHKDLLDCDCDILDVKSYGKGRKTAELVGQIW